MNKKESLIVFQGKNVRRTWFNDEWWFAIQDIVAILTDSKDPRDYIKDMRRRDEELSKGWGNLPPPLPLIQPVVSKT